MGSAVAGMVMVLGLLGAFGSGSEGAPTAPRDSAEQAARGVLPDAQVAVHGNLQGAMVALDELLGEVGKLKLVSRDQDLSAGLAMGRSGLDAMVAQLTTEAGIDLRKDVGTVTLSFAFPSEDQVRMLVRIRGNLGASRIGERLAAPGAAGEDFKGVRLTALPDSGGLRDHVFAMIDPTTMVVGSRELVQDIIDKKARKTGPAQASARLAASLPKGTRGFVYLAAPPWVVDVVHREAGTKAAADLLAGIDHLIYTVGTNGARLRVVTRDATSGRQVGHLLRASAAVLAMLEPATDALIHGWLGVAPLIPDSEMDAKLRAALSDGPAVEELGGWVKRRFGGKASVKVGQGGTVVDMELDNPASVGSLMLPVLGGAGAALWWRSSPSNDEPVEAPEAFD